MRVAFVSCGLERLGIEALSAWVRQAGHEPILVYEPRPLSARVHRKGRIRAHGHLELHIQRRSETGAEPCPSRPPTLMSGSSATDTLPPPLNLAYLAGALRKAGHEPFIVDAVGESPSNFVPLGNSRSLRGLSFDQIVARIPEDTALIGVTCMFS